MLWKVSGCFRSWRPRVRSMLVVMSFYMRQFLPDTMLGRASLSRGRRRTHYRPAAVGNAFVMRTAPMLLGFQSGAVDGMVDTRLKEQRGVTLARVPSPQHGHANHWDLRIRSGLRRTRMDHVAMFGR